MVNELNYSDRLVCSKKVKKYIHNDCKDRFLKDNPEYEGSHVSENLILTWLIKSKLALFYLENGNNK